MNSRQRSRGHRQDPTFFKNRETLFFYRAGIYRRFIDDDIAPLEHLAHNRGGGQDGPEIGSSRTVNRCRHGYDIEIRFRETGLVMIETQVRLFEVNWIDFARPIAS